MKLTKDTKRLCAECFKHRALFRHGGKVKRDSNHNLCFRRYHSLSNMYDVQRLGRPGSHFPLEKFRQAEKQPTVVKSVGKFPFGDGKYAALGADSGLSQNGQ